MWLHAGLTNFGCGENIMDLVEILNESPLPIELAFSRAEYAARVAKTQASMVEAGIDVLIISSTPNLGYLTGYDCTMSCGYTMGILQTTGDVALHASELEAPCALLFSTITDIKQFYWYESEGTAVQLGQILSDRGAGGKRIGLEMGNPETFASGAFDAESYRLYEKSRRPDRRWPQGDTRRHRRRQDRQRDRRRRLWRHDRGGLRAHVHRPHVHHRSAHRLHAPHPL
jgi:hypothetical protein